MNVIIKIQERDAIPVRALPFVAGFEQFSLSPILPPYLIAMSAGMPNVPSIGNALSTYTIENMEVRQLCPSEWGAIIEQTDRTLNDAVRKLPAGVFVYADDFSPWFKWMRHEDNLPFNHERFQINPNPLVPESLQDVVMEGFGTETTLNSGATTIPRKKNVMVSELLGMWPNIENDLNNASRKNKHGENLSARAKLPDHGMWDMAEAIRWAFEYRLINKSKANQLVTKDPTSELSVLLAHLLQ